MVVSAVKIDPIRGVVTRPPHNNGMHPTADTPPVIYFQSPGAAGDAGRYAASM
jgi:hypothetical protein